MMIIIPASFYAIVFGGGWSLDEVRLYGWTGKSDTPVEFGDLLQLYDLDLVEWSLLPSLLPVW